MLSSYPLTLLTQAVIVAILAMSLDVLLGYTGLASLGHAAYFGVAAYAVGILTTQYQMGFVDVLRRRRGARRAVPPPCSGCSRSARRARTS